MKVEKWINDRDLKEQESERVVHFPQLSGICGTEGNLIALFQEEHSRVLQLLQNFSFFPENLPIARKAFEKKTLEKQTSKKQVQGPVRTNKTLQCTIFE